jgi:hypothetical protein
MKIKAAVALVTRANRGIGASILDAWVAGGAPRIYAAVRTPSPAAKQAKVVPMALDITNVARIEDAATRCQHVGAAHLGSRPSDSMLKHRPLDVLDLSIHPVFVERGKQFFRQDETTNLKLFATKSFSKIVTLTYQPQRDPLHPPTIAKQGPIAALDGGVGLHGANTSGAVPNFILVRTHVC